MIRTTPAIVTQNAVRPLSRWLLVILCLAYILPGFLGRAPWKNADMAAFGFMRELAYGRSDWLKPLLIGFESDAGGLLPYWLGAWALQLAPQSWQPDFVARIPFVILLVLTFVATWWGMFYLAISTKAQPVAFAFGGEAQPKDYARAMADACLLALIACMGLAQLSHEVTAYVTQLCCTALLFYASAVAPYKIWKAGFSAVLGALGLALSGAPTLALSLGLGIALLACFDSENNGNHSHSVDRYAFFYPYIWPIFLVFTNASVALVAWHLDLWGWRISPAANFDDWRSLARLLLWFMWPAWPLALWTLWRWRAQWWQVPVQRHLALPLCFVAVALVATLLTQPADRALLLALPALAALAAFALPTLSRSVAALIDWFTLLFFTGAALVIWIIWISMQTGIPARPAANIARLVPGFSAEFSAGLFAIALLATFCWIWVVRWRVGRHRSVIWKSLVLPASGATLGWLLLMTLWLPLLDFARSYTHQMERVAQVLKPSNCVQIYGLSQAQIAALAYYTSYKLTPYSSGQQCQWLIVGAEGRKVKWPENWDDSVWHLQAHIPRTDQRSDAVVVLKHGFNQHNSKR